MEGPEPRWGLGDAAVGLAPFALVAVSLLAAGGDDGDDAAVTVGALVANSVLLWIFLIGVPAFATRVKGNGLVRDLGLSFRVRDLPAFALGIGLQAIVVPALYWPLFRFTDLTSDDVAQDARDLVDAASGAGVLVLVLVVSVGAPFAEELFFRGLLLRSIERRWQVGAAVAGSTVLFAASHFQGIQFPALVVFGAVAGWLAVRSGRLGPAMLCHAGFNAWTLFALLVLDQ